jgi:hypothetical protein
MADNVPFTNLDFQDVRDKLQAYLQGQEQFKDYNFEGSNMAILLDILAYNTFQNNFYTNMAMSEMFLDSAQFRDSVVSHAKELNYLPRSRRSPRATVNFELFPTDTPAAITIPAKTEWTARCGLQTFRFSNRESYIVTPNNGRYLLSNANVYEGKWIEELYEVTGDPDERFVISNNKIDTLSLRVFVRDNAESTEEIEYTFRDSLYDVRSADRVFYLQPFRDDRYEIYFGRDNFGVEPIAGNVIRIEYQVTVGAIANGISAMSITNKVSNYESSTSVSDRTIGGAERESLSSIKYYAPKSIQIQNRAVTEEDYKILLRNNFPEIRSVSVYGGEKLFPPQFGRVIIAVDTDINQGISETSRETYLDFLSDKSIISIEPIIVDAKFMYLDIATTVYYNKNFTNKSAPDIEQIARNAITQYSFNNLEEFGKNFRISRLSRTIDDADANIISNDTTVRSIIRIIPRRNVSSYFVLQFANELQPDVTYTDAQLTSYDPCVVTSVFRYGNQNVYIQDDGAGTLNIVRRADDRIIIVERNVGTVDYTTGDVILRYITIQDYTGGYIQVFARNKNRNITAPVDRIVSIDPGNVRVNVIGLRE